MIPKTYANCHSNNVKTLISFTNTSIASDSACITALFYKSTAVRRHV